MRRGISFLLVLSSMCTSAFAANFNPENWVGNWYGLWHNASFNTVGPILLYVGVDPNKKKLFARVDTGGTVYGNDDPKPKRGTGTYKNSGVTVNFEGDTDKGKAVFKPNGDMTINSTIDLAGFKSSVVTGKNKNGQMDLDYTIKFSGGGTAVGTWKMIRRPIPPLNMGDVNGNKRDDLAALDMDKNGYQMVYIKDTRTGKLLRTIKFGKNRPVAMARIPDSNGNKEREIALLSVNNSTRKVQVIIKDSKSGKTLRTLRFATSFTPADLVWVPGIGLGVLGTNSTGKVQVEIRSHKTGKLVRKIDYGTGFYAFSAAVIPGKTPKVVVAGMRRSDSMVIAVLRNAKTGKWVKTLKYAEQLLPLQVLVESKTRVSVLVCKPSNGETTLLRSTTGGQLLSKIKYGTTTIPKQVMMVGKVGGTSKPDIAYLSVAKKSGAVKAKINDSGNRKTVRTITYSKSFKPGGMVTAKNSGSSRARELAVQGSNTSTNATRLELRDLKTRTRVRTISVP